MKIPFPLFFSRTCTGSIQNMYHIGTTKHEFSQKYENKETYNCVSADKFPRLEGISPSNWLLDRNLFFLLVTG